MFDCKLAVMRQSTLRVSARDGLDALVGQHFGDQVLYVLVFATANDGNDNFDFDTDFAIEIDD